MHLNFLGMKRALLLFIFTVLFCLMSFARGPIFQLSGIIVDAKTAQPIEFATIALSDNSLWAVSNEKGEFQINKIAGGKVEIAFSCLGYVKQSLTFVFDDNITKQTIALNEDNLTLNDVVVTAKKSNDNIGTSYKIDRNTLNHMQVLNVADVSQLLPGGKTSTATSLVSASRFALRSGSSWGEMGNPTFGTGVEVDGVRLSNNATFPSANQMQTYGVDTRNISPTNIESVEIVTGIPSVEHGDISSGIVKIHTRKGITPTHIEFSTNINSKQVSANKGFSLGEKAGVMNISIDHTTSVSDIASPHTSYKRNNLAINYSNTLRKETGKPISVQAGIAGNIGGYNSEEDPDSFKDTFAKYKDNMLRANFSANWLLNYKWITNLKLSTSYTQSDRKQTVKKNQSSSTSTSAIHSTEEGYFVATRYEDNPDAPVLIIPPGYWFETMYEDDKPINFTANLKADWSKRVSNINNKIMIGADYSMSSNKGHGVYYDDMRLAPSWREYRYSDIPTFHNLAWYVQDQLKLYLNTGTFELTAGVRADNSYIEDSEYGAVSSFSPRLNAKYKTVHDNSTFIRQLSFHAGWGKTVKLPSFNILYPEPGYRDLLTFVAPTTSDNTYFTAYYTQPAMRIYNSDLKWQSNMQSEIGAELNTRWAKISVTAYYNLTQNPYSREAIYSPFTYKMTDQRGLNAITIPSANRQYIVNQQTGIVTVADRTGSVSNQIVEYKERTRARSDYYYGNGSPLHRAGLEWIVDFEKIEALKTSFRFDGKFYYYKGVDKRVQQSTSSSAQLMPNGEYYKYIGFYNGGTSIANGSVSKQSQANLTIITHIPQVRMIVSLRLEGSLYTHSQSLSEFGGSQRGFVLDSPGDFFPSPTQTDIYAGNQYVGLYPDYYISFDDMETKIPFEEKFRWAKENDMELYNNLARLIEKTSYNFTFNPSKISTYFSANINITKEIGDVASVSFYAKNFINNMSLTKDSQREYEQTLYNSGKIPPFQYGLTLRLKL